MSAMAGDPWSVSRRCPPASESVQEPIGQLIDGPIATQGVADGDQEQPVVGQDDAEDLAGAGDRRRRALRGRAAARRRAG